METLLILVVMLAIIALACAFPVLIGRWFSRRLKKSNPTSQFIRPMRSSEVIGQVVGAAGVLSILATRQLFPASLLGSLIQPIGGLVAALLVWSVVSAAIVVRLRKDPGAGDV